MIKRNCLDCDKQLSRNPQTVRCHSCAQKIKNQVYGFKKGSHPSPQTEFKKGQNTGEDNVKWVGNKVGYRAIHSWIERKLGKAYWCTWCFSMKNIHWANWSHEYKRDVNDWIQLCHKCHFKYDSGKNWGSIKNSFIIRNNHPSIRRNFGKEVL